MLLHDLLALYRWADAKEAAAFAHSKFCDAMARSGLQGAAPDCNDLRAELRLMTAGGKNALLVHKL